MGGRRASADQSEESIQDRRELGGLVAMHHVPGAGGAPALRVREAGHPPRALLLVPVELGDLAVDEERRAMDPAPESLGDLELEAAVRAASEVQRIMLERESPVSAARGSALGETERQRRIEELVVLAETRRGVLDGGVGLRRQPPDALPAEDPGADALGADRMALL